MTKLALLVFLFSFQASALTPKVSYLPFWNGALQVRTGEYRPAGEIRGDILYLHGFADRLDNHDPLFTEWLNKGFRVIAFDLPSHGENKGPLNHLGLFTFYDLADLTYFVEEKTREDASRPLIVAGWSTGGLIALRAAVNKTLGAFARKPKAMILFAPGISVRTVIKAKVETLTRLENPPHKGPLQPVSPVFFHGAFPAELLSNALLSQAEQVPADLPVFLALADDKDDRYVKSQVIKKWTLKQRAGNARIMGLQCRGSYHEIDNELEIVSKQVRENAATFADAIVSAREFVPALGEPCGAF